MRQLGVIMVGPANSLTLHGEDDEDVGDAAVDSTNECEGDQLNNVLKDAAMEDKTVILTTLNDAWAAPGSIFDLFLESFNIGDDTGRLLNHLAVIALDQKAYKRCLVVHGRCYALVAPQGVDFSPPASYMNDEYLKMMWRRTDFLHTVLELGYNFVFTDTDIMWFRNPFPRFYEDADFQIACDHFTGDPDDINNWPNGGYKFVRANSKTIEFYRFWYSSRETYPGMNEQDVLNLIKSGPFVSQIGLKMKFLSTAYFGGLCEPSEDLNLVCTMHVNCCIGLENKIADLKVMLDDWRQYTASSDDVRKSSPLSWHVPRNCSL
uniref:Nucleotide-diphospho-sugar transferase domain-containing protein n=2 Tax=Kalanchoe fedtschenkoi TaxID=63787 RepID=A0A7N0TG22_KALFE